MKKWSFCLSFVLLFTTVQIFSIKILHITLHEGCKKDFEEVAHELNLDLTSWFVQELERNQPGFWEGSYVGNEIYNVGPNRAKRIWDRHKDFFNTFDLIMTSDTAPLSRIFLQNGWKKPLVIWVCNRFDYQHPFGGEEGFPDPAYYTLIKQATNMPHVRIISYTAIEHIYARQKGIELGTRLIKPLGIKSEPSSSPISKIPAHIKRTETLFLYPRFDRPNQEPYIKKNCLEQNIKIYSGPYNGPDDLQGFKGIIYFPYQWSNLALFEHLQRGYIHFVPSEKFILEHAGDPIRYPTLSEFDLCEWYNQENRPYIIYFDSWSDLKFKMKNTDYAQLRKKIIEYGTQHRTEMLSRWNTLLHEIVHTNTVS